MLSCLFQGTLLWLFQGSERSRFLFALLDHEHLVYTHSFINWHHVYFRNSALFLLIVHYVDLSTLIIFSSQHNLRIMHEHCRLLKIIFYNAFLLIIFSYDVYIYTHMQSNRPCSCRWAQLVSELSDLATLNAQVQLNPLPCNSSQLFPGGIRNIIKRLQIECAGGRKCLKWKVVESVMNLRYLYVHFIHWTTKAVNKLAAQNITLLLKLSPLAKSMWSLEAAM